MKPIKLLTILALAPLAAISLAFADDQTPPPQVSFFGSGFTMQAPAGASQLELRIVDPARNPVFTQSSDGTDIHWTLTGSEGPGEYRYEAVVVTNVNGTAKQRNAAGGFEVHGGVLIGPPDASELEARLRELEKPVSE